MRWALKIILFPIILLLSILIAFLKFIIKVSGMILGIISFLIFIGVVACFVKKLLPYQLSVKYLMELAFCSVYITEWHLKYFLSFLASFPYLLIRKHREN